MKMESKQQKTENLMRDEGRYARSKINRNIAWQNWSLMYTNIGSNENISFPKSTKKSRTFEKNRSENKKKAQNLALKRTALSR